jgi:hypothetical protein
MVTAFLRNTFPRVGGVLDSSNTRKLAFGSEMAQTLRCDIGCRQMRLFGLRSMGGKLSYVTESDDLPVDGPLVCSCVPCGKVIMNAFGSKFTPCEICVPVPITLLLDSV